MINSFEKFVSKEMTGFLVTVVEKDRAYAIKDILNYFLNKVKEYKGIGTAYVTTPVEPDKAARSMHAASKNRFMYGLLNSTGIKIAKVGRNRKTGFAGFRDASHPIPGQR